MCHASGRTCPSCGDCEPASAPSSAAPSCLSRRRFGRRRANADPVTCPASNYKILREISSSQQSTIKITKYCVRYRHHNSQQSSSQQSTIIITTVNNKNYKILREILSSQQSSIKITKYCVRYRHHNSQQ